MTEGVVDTPVAPAAEVDGQVLETTTARDADLPVNQSASVAPVAPVEKPVYLTEQDLAKSSSPIAGQPAAAVSSTADSLAEQIEALSGEIQALEAKIDRLTSNVSVPNGPSSMAPPASPRPVADLVAKPPIASVAPVAPATLPDVAKLTTPTDLYAKISSDSRDQNSKTAGSIKIGEEDEEEHSGAVSSIGAILAVVGLIVFLIMLVSPLVRELIGIGVWNAISQVGWLVALGSLGLGLLLMVFSPGKTALKVICLLAIILLALMFLGVSGYDYLFGPLKPTLEPLFSFYR